MPFASRRAFLCAAAVAALAVPAYAADGPAAQLIEKVAGEVIELIKTTQGAQREAGIRAVLLKYFDLPQMGRAALATHWDATNPEQRERFLKAVVSAEARAYSERFGQYGGQTLAVTSVSNRPNNVSVVSSKLNQSNGQPIAIQWEVRDSGQGLRITDVKIEGVSMVMTRRSDFNSYISSHGGKVEPLIDELETRANR
jgi:phospholipid transport system substrate-binding protein